MISPGRSGFSACSRTAGMSHPAFDLIWADRLGSSGVQSEVEPAREPLASHGSLSTLFGRKRRTAARRIMNSFPSESNQAGRIAVLNRHAETGNGAHTMARDPNHIFRAGIRVRHGSLLRRGL